MRGTHVKALEDALKTTRASREQVLWLWNQESPHFLNSGDHRYEFGHCVYCNRPEDYVTETAR